MYSIRDYRTNKMFSWWQETPDGLKKAIVECDMRTHASGRGHIVTDNHGLRLHLALPKREDGSESPTVAEVKSSLLYNLWCTSLIIMFVSFAIWAR